MNISQVAAQLYTVRDQCKTPDAIAQSLQRIAQIGYRAVQVSGLGPIEEADLKQLCADNNLTLCATHESCSAILDTPEVVIERLEKLGCQHTAIGFPSGIDLGSREGVLDFARRFEEAARLFVAAGLTVSHHNHQHEFRRLNGQTVMQILLANTSSVMFELDTYWAQFGGANSVSYCEMLANRMPLLHLKDYAVGADNQPYFAEIGQGNLEFVDIIAAAEAGGCEWFIVEQDTTPGDPFDSLAISFNYIATNLCSL